VVPEPMTQPTFPNQSAAGPLPVSLLGIPEVFTQVPSGSSVAIILPPLRNGDIIVWHYATCGCSRTDLAFWVEGPSGDRSLPVHLNTTAVLLNASNFLQVKDHGTYRLVWENLGTDDVELAYIAGVRRAGGAPSEQGTSTSPLDDSSLTLLGGGGSFLVSLALLLSRLRSRAQHQGAHRRRVERIAGGEEE